MSASGRISTYCLRQWVIQVRRRARPATSTHRIGPSRTGLRSTGTGAGGGKRRRTALTRRARSPLAAFCQTLLSQRTELTIRLIGQVDGSLGKGILTRALRSTTDWPRLGSAASRSLATRSPLPRNAPWLVRTRWPTATGHTLAVRVLKLRRLQEFLWEGPTRVSRTWTPCILCLKARGAGSTPIDTQFATALAHTRWRNTSDRDLLRCLHRPAPPRKRHAHDRDRAHPAPGTPRHPAS